MRRRGRRNILTGGLSRARNQNTPPEDIHGLDLQRPRNFADVHEADVLHSPFDRPGCVDFPIEVNAGYTDALLPP